MGVSLWNMYFFFIIDVEVSGFGVKSYFIEIGVVCYDGVKWCKLIRFFDYWVYWDEEVEVLYGIICEMLNNYGLSFICVCYEFNYFFSNI